MSINRIYNENVALPKYMKITKIMRETESQLTISCHPTKLPKKVLDVLLLIVWLMESHRNFQTTHSVAKTISCSGGKNGIKAPLLTTAPIQLIKHGEGKLVSTKNLHLYVLVIPEATL